MSEEQLANYVNSFNGTNGVSTGIVAWMTPDKNIVFNCRIYVPVDHLTTAEARIKELEEEITALRAPVRELVVAAKEYRNCDFDPEDTRWNDIEKKFDEALAAVEEAMK